MKFDDQHSFDQPAETVIRMFTDRAYFERKYRELGFADIQVLEHESSPNRFRIKVRYSARNTVALPEFAKKFIPGTAIITQTDSWDPNSMIGRIDAEIRGAPVKVRCDMTLRNVKTGAVNQLHWTVSCGIPLIGGKLEKVTSEDIQAKAGNDLAITRRILREY